MGEEEDQEDFIQIWKLVAVVQLLYSAAHK